MQDVDTVAHGCPSNISDSWYVVPEGVCVRVFHVQRGVCTVQQL